MNLDATNQQKWSDLLTQAVAQPGLILKAYSAFHGYSLGNQLAVFSNAIVTASSQARSIHIKDGSTKADTSAKAKRQSGSACRITTIPPIQPLLFLHPTTQGKRKG